MSILRVHLLNGFRLIYGEDPVPTIGKRQQAMLAYLILHRSIPQPRQHLAHLFWPNSSEHQAHTNLRNLFFQLRQTIPDTERFVRFDGKNVQWRSESSFVLDVAEFENAVFRAEEASSDAPNLEAVLESAVHLYGGVLLPAHYDEWVLAERSRLQTLFFKTLERLVDLTEGQRNYAKAIELTRRLLASDPLREDAYRRLMRLYALSNDRARALRTYTDCVALLQRELQTEPSPATRNLYKSLVAQGSLAARQESRSKDEAQAGVTLPLVGRKREWKRLLGEWHRTRRGHAHLVLVSGEAGIGKTRFVEAFAEWATLQGISTVMAQCYAPERYLSYAPVVNWLRLEPLQDALAKVDDFWLVEVSRLLPELRMRLPHLAEPVPLTQGWQRQRLFEALTHVVTSAKLPLLLVLDDIQWCDAETLEWLHYLLRSKPQAQLLVVATLRIKELDENSSWVSVRSHLQRQHSLSEIELGPLNETQTGELAALVAGKLIHRKVRKVLYRETEGHPLFIVEMTRTGATLVDSSQSWFQMADSPRLLPTSMQMVIHARLHQLSAPARALMDFAAVIGRQFGQELLAAASGVEPKALTASLDEALRRRILRKRATGGYDFSHERIREFAYQNMSQGRRRLLHESVAKGLEQCNPDQIESISDQLAYHYERAGHVEQAVRHYRQAAETAQRLFAYQETLQLLTKALELLQQLPETAERDQLELELQIMRGPVLLAMRGLAASEVEQSYSRAQPLDTF